MRSVNKVILVGNLTRAPEMRQTPNGQSVTTFGVATNREWTTKENDRKSSAEFHECVAWAKLAEICNQYLSKGQLVYVEGYLKTRSWDTPEGVKKFKTEIVVKDMIRLEKRGSGDDQEEYYSPDEDEVEGEFETTEETKTPEPTTEESEKKENALDEDLGL
jgi:single-strand DNA-binding protein